MKIRELYLDNGDVVPLTGRSASEVLIDAMNMTFVDCDDPVLCTYCMAVEDDSRAAVFMALDNGDEDVVRARKALKFNRTEMDMDPKEEFIRWTDEMSKGWADLKERTIREG